MGGACLSSGEAVKEVEPNVTRQQAVRNGFNQNVRFILYDLSGFTVQHGEDRYVAALWCLGFVKMGEIKGVMKALGVVCASN